MLDAGRIDVIQFEYGKVNIITHFLLRDFYEFLEPRGYLVGRLFPDFVDFRAYALEDEDFSGPNYVAVRKTRSDIVDALSKHQPLLSGRFLLRRLKQNLSPNTISRSRREISSSAHNSTAGATIHPESLQF